MTLLTYQTHLRVRLQQSGVPAHWHRELLDYISERRPVGTFLQAVLENNLSAAITRTDDAGHATLPYLVRFLVNYVPGECWGSAEQVAGWLADPTPAPEIFE